MGHHDEQNGAAGDGAAASGPTDMTADNIAPEDVPTPDPANTEVPAGGGKNEENQQ